MMRNRKNKRLMSAEENALFCSQIVMLLKAGIPLHDGIRTLSETYRGTVYEERFSIIDEAIRKTGSLADAVAAASMFPKHIRDMIHVGERAGILEEVLDALDEYYQREARVRRAVKSAVLYPLLLVIMMAVVIGILSIRVMPIFTRVYDSLGAQASATADTMIRLGSVIGQVVLWIVAVLLVIIIVLFILLHTKQRENIKTFLLNLFPGMKRISRQIAISRFSSVLAKLLEGGFPVEEAISLVAGIVPDPDIAGKVEKSREEMIKGISLADALTNAGIYEEIHTKMLKVAGMSGSIDKTMRKLGELYDEAADAGIRRIVSLIEPAIVSILAIIIGAILLAVMLPLASILTVIA